MACLPLNQFNGVKGGCPNYVHVVSSPAYDFLQPLQLQSEVLCARRALRAPCSSAWGWDPEPSGPDAKPEKHHKKMLSTPVMWSFPIALKMESSAEKGLDSYIQYFICSYLDVG